MSVAQTATFSQTARQARRAVSHARRIGRSDRIARYLTPERIESWGRTVTVILAALFMTLMFVEPAAAQSTSGSDVGTLLTNIISFFNSGVIRSIAIIAIIILGLTCMFGVMDIRRAGLVILGIIIVFGASTIVGMVTGGGAAGA